MEATRIFSEESESLTAWLSRRKWATSFKSLTSWPRLSQFAADEEVVLAFDLLSKIFLIFSTIYTYK